VLFEKSNKFLHLFTVVLFSATSKLSASFTTILFLLMWKTVVVKKCCMYENKNIYFPLSLILADDDEVL